MRKNIGWGKSLFEVTPTNSSIISTPTLIHPKGTTNFRYGLIRSVKVLLKPILHINCYSTHLYTFVNYIEYGVTSVISPYVAHLSSSSLLPCYYSGLLTDCNLNKGFSLHFVVSHIWWTKRIVSKKPVFPLQSVIYTPTHCHPKDTKKNPHNQIFFMTICHSEPLLRIPQYINNM